MIYRGSAKRFLILFLFLVVFSTIVFVSKTFAQTGSTPSDGSVPPVDKPVDPTTTPTPIPEPMDPNYTGDAEGSDPIPISTPTTSNPTTTTVIVPTPEEPEKPNPFSTNTTTTEPIENTTVSTNINTENPTAQKIPIIPIAVGTGILVLGGGIFLALKSKKKEDPCDTIKKQFDVKNTELQNINNKISIQELVVEKAQKEIDKTKDAITDTVTEKTEEKVLESIGNENLSKTVAVAHDAKDIYDNATETYQKAVAALEFLKNEQTTITAEFATLDAAYKKCLIDTIHIETAPTVATVTTSRELPPVNPKQTRKSTLLFLFRRKDKHILLAMKKRGFGKDKYNGVGGKLENNETIEEALVRETREEIHVSVNADDFKEVAILDFFFKNKPEWNQQVYVFFTETWEGEPRETDEMRPEWYPVESIPYDTMWIDDKHWLPLVLAGKNIHASFTFNETGSEILDMQIKKA